jgi:hypothetical protein
MPETSDWQLIGQVPIDTGRLALVDPMNVDDVSRHEEMDEAGSMTYQVVTNDYGVGVAVLLGTGLGDGVYPVEARFEEAEGSMRIAEVRVRFLPDPVIGYELPCALGDAASKAAGAVRMAVMRSPARAVAGRTPGPAGPRTRHRPTSTRTAPAGRSSASRCSCATATGASFTTPTSASAEPPRSIT